MPNLKNSIDTITIFHTFEEESVSFLIWSDGVKLNSFTPVWLTLIFIFKSEIYVTMIPSDGIQKVYIVRHTACFCDSCLAENLDRACNLRSTRAPRGSLWMIK